MIEETTKDETKLLAIEVDKDLHDEIKAYAKKVDRSMASLIRVAVKEYMERNPLEPVLDVIRNTMLGCRP
ncbi:MAG: hypothetical protein Q6359_10685 [Candidatus Brocadiales bacterium]|nr:hypothetical protein [Candidatus Brocadiales bacterium]